MSYWDEVADLFDEAAAMPTAERAAFLDERCSDRPDLRREVESLLFAHADAGRFIEPETSAPGETHDAGTRSLGLGDVVGRFRLLQEIGVGGMASVYRAERADGDFEHQVAVKLLAAPVAHPATERRFQLERQILASLRHPNVVTLLDGGVASDGRGYLAMEFVEGVPITTYCRDHALSLRERLRLFRDVCSGVHYAHRHGVVHRDLKPSNILVTDERIPKVLDFGIAKMTDDAETPGGATVTGLGVGALTPAYASPEQLRGLPVTTSSDIYALGVLLYELVAGKRPYDVSGRSFEDVVKLVVETDPARPSSASGDVSSQPPYDRSRALRGDVDAIVLRAMAKEPDERYGSAEELSADVLRHLEGRPVEARPPSFGYVIRRLAARHRAAFVSAGVSLLLLVAAMCLVVWQARVARVEQRRAERRFEEVRQLANTLIFDIHDAVTPLDGSTPVRQRIVSEGLRYLERLAPEAEDDPALQEELARAYAQIGRIQGLPSVPNLGDREAALSSFRKGASLLRPLAARTDAPLETVVAYVDLLGNFSMTLASLDEGDAAASTAVAAVDAAEAALRRHDGDDEARSLWARANFMAAVTLGWPDSLPYWRAAETAYEDLLSERPEDPSRQRNAALVHKYLGSYFDTSGEPDAALRHHERALDLDEERLEQAPDDRTARFDVAISLGNVAYEHRQRGQPERALELYLESLSLREELAEADPEDALARNRLAYAHFQIGEIYEELGDRRAARHARSSVRLFQSLSAPPVERMDEAKAFSLLSRLEARSGRSAESCRAAIEAFAIMSAVSEASRLRVTVERDDLLPQVARRAAQCGHGSASDWLAAQGSPSSR